MTQRRLIKDPQLPRGGVSPYDRLAMRLEVSGAMPIGPASTAAQVKDSYFDLMQSGPVDAADRTAWDTLRFTASRLVADFFLYDLPEPELETLQARLSEEIPVTYPDFRQLADVEPDFSAIPAVAQLPVSSAPSWAERFPPPEAPPIDLGPDNLDILKLLEGCGE